MSAVVLLMQKYPTKKESMILIVNSTNHKNDQLILDVVKKYCKYYKVKSKNVTSSSLDMIIEIKVPQESDLVDEVIKIEGVSSASILTHDGEITA